MSMLDDLGTVAPLWLPVLGAVIVLLLTVSGGYRRPAPRSDTHLVLVSLAFIVAAAWVLLGTEGNASAFSGALTRDGIGVVFGLIALLGAGLAIPLAAAYLGEHGLSRGEYYALVLLASAGMVTLAMCGDLIALFIGIEIMSIAVYVLTGYRRTSRTSQEAAMKYFIFGSFASAFALFGIALIYGEVGRLTGTPALAFHTIARAFAQSQQVAALGWIGTAMVIGGLAFKVAAVPFHMWAPDVYDGAPTPTTAFMAVGVKTAAFAGLCRFVAATLVAMDHSRETAIQLFELLAILSMVAGNLLAVRQKQIKRMLAYSSIAHAGYLLVGVVAFIARPESVALESIAYYLFGYTAMTLGAFGVVLAFERRDDRRADLPIDRLAGAAYRYPALGLGMALFMFSLAGVPPTAGFFGKLVLFGAAIEAGRVGLVVVAVLASAVGAFYYLRVTVVLAMRASGTDEQCVESRWLSAALLACGVLTLGVGLLPDPFLLFARRALVGWLTVHSGL